MDTILKNLLKLLLIYAALFLLGTLLYVASFHTRLLSGFDVFFYRGLALILFWGILIAILMLVLKRMFFHNLITLRDVLLLFMGFCCIHVVLFTHLPVTADRSISVFMLGYMADHADSTFTEEDIESYFISRYVLDYQAFSKRFHEQEEIHTIEADGDGYRITEQGIALMEFYELIAKCFGLDTKLIHP